MVLRSFPLVDCLFLFFLVNDGCHFSDNGVKNWAIYQFMVKIGKNSHFMALFEKNPNFMVLFEKNSQNMVLLSEVEE